MRMHVRLKLSCVKTLNSNASVRNLLSKLVSRKLQRFTCRKHVRNQQMHVNCATAYTELLYAVLEVIVKAGYIQECTPWCDDMLLPRDKMLWSRIVTNVINCTGVCEQQKSLKLVHNTMHQAKRWPADMSHVYTTCVQRLQLQQLHLSCSP
jgi:hypothetical protein